MTKDGDKKEYVELPDVAEFMNAQSPEVRNEYDVIASRLAHDGHLNMPYGEKIKGKNLFAIRIIQAGNIRVFYVYGVKDRIIGIHGYVKKTQQIPNHELNCAVKIMKLLKAEGLVK